MGCFASLDPTTCDQACTTAGANCYEWVPADVAKYQAFCADPTKPTTAKKAALDCVIAASQQSWFACGQCKPPS
jgi:hypothetical protein